MKDEIREILDYCNKYINDKYMQYSEPMLNAKSLKLLLDYITNLQEQLHKASLDIQELTEKDIGCPSWCDKLTNLQEENKNLHIQLEDKANEQIKTMYLEYKSRNEKAIKLLKEAGCYEEDTKTFCGDIYQELPELLNILQGEDKDE